MEMMISTSTSAWDPDLKRLNVTPTLPFFFVSDNYTVNQVGTALVSTCIDMSMGDPVPFNPAGNIGQGSVLQSFRGGTGVVVLPGYTNAQQLSGNPNLVPNP